MQNLKITSVYAVHDIKINNIWSDISYNISDQIISQKGITANMSTFFTSDLHFGHKNIIKYDNRPFSNITDMDTTIIKNWNNKVQATDSVYILGDISWYNATKTADIINQLNGHKILIIGNHETKLSPIVKACFDSIKSYAEIHEDGKTLILSHYPIHFYNHQFHGAIMLYGHVHNSESEQLVQRFKIKAVQCNIPCNMYNVGIMHWNYEPVTLNEILNTVKY